MNYNNYHLIRVKYLGPTDTKGSRFKMTSDRFEQSVTESYNYTHNNIADMAQEWLENNGHNVIGRGELRDEYVIICDHVDNQFKPLKEQ